MNHKEVAEKEKKKKERKAELVMITNVLQSLGLLDGWLTCWVPFLIANLLGDVGESRNVVKTLPFSLRPCSLFIF